MNHLKKICIAIVILIAMSSYAAHKFYVSVSQIEYNEEKKRVEIISRIFIDDFEKLLRERYEDKLVMMTADKEQEKKIDHYTDLYLSQKLIIKVNGEKRLLKFLGKEYDNDIMLCYLEISEIDTLESIEISNEVLTEIFEEQQNIVHVKKGNTKKSLILEKENHVGAVKF